MSAQTTLTEDAPLVLDATCSNRKIWPKFATLRMDIRREVKPDIVASATHLPFKSGIFQHIYCDPPHIIRSKMSGAWVKRKSLSGERFGFWKNRTEWLNFLEGFNTESIRTLKKDGMVHIKVSYNSSGRGMVHRDEINLLSNLRLIEERVYKSKLGWSTALTSFLTMKPKEAPA